MPSNNDYAKKIEREKQWYTQPVFQKDHFLNSRLFYSAKRHEFNYHFLKQRMSQLISQAISNRPAGKLKILIAPIGNGDDLKYLGHLSGDISGIDVFQDAIRSIGNANVKAYVGDMKSMDMFKNGNFDIVIVPLFFHHFTKFGLDDFLKECCRVLKPNGLFFTLEPSSFYPFSWLTRLGRKIFGNITGLVEDEAPLDPRALAAAMRRCGIKNIKIVGASYSHNRFPIPFAKIINFLTVPLAKLPILNYLAWMCLLYGEK